ncbi:MAG: ImmA/IrrE family metallo-endopeptidase [Acidimicrobiia bacterium]|nr:ImmA/IrrE family metallo-endopeptidase [Acidimicrobiia bacterium]
MEPVVLRVEVSPGMLAWARARSRIESDALSRRFPRLGAWEAGRGQPTLKQLEQFAAATRTPIGYLFLTEPPPEPVPIPDFRTVADTPVGKPSPDLLDVIFQCQQRQEWFSHHARVNRFDPVAFVGSATLEDPPETVAGSMRQTLDFAVEDRGATWTEAFRRLSDAAEDAGVLVMASGIVGSNTHRRLDPAEFRGFALVDLLAPLVFVNTADTRAAQVFTLAHELAHLWLGETGLDDASPDPPAHRRVERWCSRAAAEFLVPMEQLRLVGRAGESRAEELDRLARMFKVSTLVILRRLYEAGRLTREEYRLTFNEESARISGLSAQPGAGGNFYHTQPVRVSKRFARSVISSTLEGQTLFTEAFRMLGFRKQSTFDELARRLGVL